MKEKRIFAGLDVGTSSMKAVLIEIANDQCRVLYSQGCPYNESGTPERDPDKWLAVAHQLLEQLLQIRIPDAIGFTGQMHTFLAVDKHNNTIAPVKLWLDMDGFQALNKIGLSRRQWLERTGNIPLPDFTLAKWLWAIEQDPQLPDKVFRLYCAKDIIRAGLDLNAPFVIDSNEATGTQCFDPVIEQWQPNIIEMAKLPLSVLPAVVDARTEAGYLDLANYGKQSEMVPLIVGAGDQATAARAVGGHQEGVVSVSLGTSGVLSFNLDKQAFPNVWKGDFHWFPIGFDDKQQIIGTIPSLGSTLDWFMRLHHLSKQTFQSHSLMALEQSTNVCFLPFMAGIGAPEPNHDVRAAWFNESTSTELVDLIRALFNGIALEFCHIIRQAQQLNILVERLVFSGGGAHIDALLAIIASTTGYKCYKIEELDASAIGAALLAADSQIATNHVVLPCIKIKMTDRHPVSDEYRKQWQQYRTSLKPNGAC